MVLKATGQELATNPSTVKWNRYKSDHFKLIYPKGLDSVANHTINLLETNFTPISNSLGKKPRPISVILQNQNTESNGFVTITPRKSEFFITPPQDYTLLGTYNWLDLLATHEFRHVVQYDKALTGITKVIYGISGNFGLSGLSHVVMPSWFWEGDAVGIETAHSQTGRGSIPSFSMLMRSQLADYNKPFSFSKANGRSFKQNIPNHYVLGYHLTSVLKEKYGHDSWDKILDKTFKFPLYPFSFSNNVKKVTGKSTDNFYASAFQELKKEVVSKIENRKLYEDNYLRHKKEKYYTDYEFPQYLDNGNVLALKSGLAHISQFVILDKNRVEKKVLEIGSLNDGLTLSLAQNKVVWSEFSPDPRWEMRNFSNIKLLDINTGKLTYLTHKSRLAAPSLSPDGRQIVAVNTSNEGKYSLQLINADSGNMWKEFENRENIFYQHPSWSSDGKNIVVVSLLKNEKSIQMIDVATGQVKNILPFSNNNYAHPVLKNNLLLYNNAKKGIDNIYLYDLNEEKNYQVTDAKFGAFNGIFSADGSKILFTDFTSLGHRVAAISFEMKSFILDQSFDNKPVRMFANWMVDEAKQNTDQITGNRTYKSQPYSKWNLLNINSWGVTANSTGNSLILGIDTQDLLSTATSSIGVGYNPIEKQSNYFANISYQGFFPIFDLNFENQGRQTIIPKGSLKDQKVDLVDNWRQQTMSVGARLPFSFQRNKFYSKLNMGVLFSYIEGQGYDLANRYTSQIGSKSMEAITNYFTYSRKMKNAKRDIGPRWEQNISLYARNTPLNSQLQSKLFALQGSLVVPGVGKHDNFRLRANLLTNGKESTYYFSSPIAFPRGYEYSVFDKMTMASVDYRFPIADPDLAIGRILYIQRLKGNIFGDFGQGQFTDDKNNLRKIAYNSIGADLSAIFNIMRFATAVELGVRFNYIPKPQQGQQQFIITPLIIDIPF